MQLKKNIKIFLLALIALPFFMGNLPAQDHYIFNRDDLIDNIRWTRGCTPTAAAMVLRFYDSLTPIGVISLGGKFFGKLVEYYEIHPVSDRNVPFPLIDNLHDAMGTTDPEGATNELAISGGIEYVTDTLHGYDFGAWTDDDHACMDWDWPCITGNINANRPLIWNIGIPTQGHSMCAVGYTDSKYVIVRDSNRSYETRWKYNVYEYTGQGATRTSVTHVVPVSSPATSTIFLDSPIGGESLTGNTTHTIWWYQFGTNITYILLGYSSDQGRNWTEIPGSVVPSYEGWNSFEWTVPNVDSNNSRVSIHGYGPPYMAGDGSYSNFSISYNRNLILPGQLSAVSPGLPNSISLQWSDPNSDPQETGYKIRIKPSGGSYSYFTVGQNINTYLKSNLIANKTYYWNVMAVGDGSNCYDSSWANWGVDSQFSVPPAKITVTAPTVGTIWTYNASRTITWNSISCQNMSVKIQLYKGLVKKLDISPATANDGSFDWTIPANLAKGLYTIRVSTTDGRVVGKSSQFTITNGYVKVLVPIATVNWIRGKSYNVIWEADGAIQTGMVKIALYKGLAKVLDISTGTDIGPGSFSWSVPAGLTLASTYSIKVTTIDNLFSGQSGKFSIVAGIMEVRTPAAGARWQRGVPHTITWVQVVQSFSPTVKIQLFRGTSLVSTLSASTENDASFDWTIPAGQALASNYKIRITTADNLVKAESGKFTISNTP